MDSERIFKTCIFGGFKREDVLAYVDELKGQIASLSGDLQQKGGELSALQAKADELSALCEAGEEAKRALAKTSESLSAATAQNAALQAENDALHARLSAMDDEKRKMDEKAEELRETQAQLGAAFLDARKYSDEIVSAANRKANDAQLDAAQSIRDRAGDIARLTADVDAIAANFTRSVEDLRAEIAALSSKLTQSAQALSVRREEKFVPDVIMRVAETLDAAPASDANIYRLDTPKEG